MIAKKKGILEAFADYIRVEKRYSEHTVAAYMRDIKRFLSDMDITEKEFDPALVTGDDIRTWIIGLSKAGMKPSSVNRMTSSLRSLFRYFRKAGLVNADPFLRIAMLKTPTRLPGFIPESKMKELLDGTDPENSADDFTAMRNRLIIDLFYTTGIRLAELYGIKLDDFSAGFAELKIRGKGDKERVVPLLSRTRDKIKEYLTLINKENICNCADNYLFLTDKGNRVGRSEIYRIVKDELSRAGVQGKKSPHILRHTFATHLLNDGADIREIQQILGHSSLSATQVYTHNSITKLKEAYERAHPRSKKK